MEEEGMRRCQLILGMAASIVEELCPPERRQEAFGVAALAIRENRDAREAVREWMGERE